MTPNEVQTSTPSRRAIILLGAITALVIACIAVAVVMRGGSQTETNLHRQKWLARPFNAYEIRLVSGDCDLIYEVIDEQVQLPMTQSACRIEARSVSELFDAIEQIPECGPNGCGCDGPIETIVEYDTELGYPKRVETVLNRDARVRYPIYWLKRIPPFSACTDAGFSPTEIEIITLNPLN